MNIEQVQQGDELVGFFKQQVDKAIETFGLPKDLVIGFLLDYVVEETIVRLGNLHSVSLFNNLVGMTINREIKGRMN